MKKKEKKKAKKGKKVYPAEENKAFAKELLQTADVVMKFEDLSHIIAANFNPIWKRLKDISDLQERVSKLVMGFAERLEALEKKRKRP